VQTAAKRKRNGLILTGLSGGYIISDMARPSYKLNIIVGTANELKIGGVRLVCGKLMAAGFLQGGFEVTGVDIPSGVSRTPLTFKETEQGAINRAQGAWQALKEKGREGMGVGIEAGVDLRRQETGTFVAVARVSKKNLDAPTIFIAQSATFPLFKKHVAFLKEGMSLGEILRAESKGRLHSDSGGGGYDALVTGGVATREDVLYLALLSAIIRSLRDQKIYHEL